MNVTIELYADGACKGNPGPGGWACILLHPNAQRHLSGFEPMTTNNRMELLAVISGLKVIERASLVHIVTDSQYVCKAFTESWIKRWAHNGWKSKSGGSVKNQDLWVELHNLHLRHSLSFEWVKGHSGHKWNELCDSLANEAIFKRRGIDERFPKD